MIEKIKRILSQEEVTTDDIMNTFTLEERQILAAGTSVYDLNSMEESSYIYDFIEKSNEEEWILLTSKEALEFIQQQDENQLEELIYILKRYMFSEDLYALIKDKENFDTLALDICSELDDDDIILEILEKMDMQHDDDARYRYENIIQKITNVELKIKMMKKYLKRDQYADIIENLENDEDKVKYMHLVPFGYRLYVITQIKSDEIKERYIHLYKVNRTAIIASLESDQKKEYYLNKYFHIFTGVERSEIISSFESIELVKKHCQTITSESAILSFIDSNCNDEELIPICNRMAQRLKKEKNIVQALEYLSDKITRYTLIKRLRNEKYIREVISSNRLTATDINQLLVAGNDRIIELIFQTRAAMRLNPEIIFNILSRLKDKNKIFKIIDHIENFPEYQDKYKEIVELYAKKYSLDLDHLITLLKITDMSLISSLGNNNIQDIINLENDNFEKFIKIFNPESFELTESAHNAILNALIQKKFDLNNKRIIQYSTILENALVLGIKTNDFSKLELLIDNMLEVIHIEDFHITKDELIQGLKNNNEDMKNKMREMAHKFIVFKKNEYLGQEMPTARRKTSIATYEKNAYFKYYLKTVKIWGIINDLEYKVEDEPEIFTKEEIKLINNKEVLRGIILFNKNPQEHKEYIEYIKQYNKTFTSILEKTVDRSVKDPIIPNLPIKYEITKTKEKNLVGILTSIKVEQIKNTLFKDEEALQELIDFIKKYKILGWCDRFEELATAADLSFTMDSIAELINNYPLIIQSLKKQAEKEKRPFVPTLIKIMDEASIYDTYSQKFTLLFGKENFRRIKANTGKYKGSWTKEQRISKSVALIKEMYKKEAIPVPSIDKNYETETNKKVHVVLGNTTDLINLTLGERTDACMRLGSAGDRLFRYALLDNKGFHIILYHPETGEFISRLSCFRSGNTVVFNQLRHSVLPEYTDEELIGIIKQLADDLITSTKDSTSPIDNVIINDRYGMENSKMKSVPLGVDVTESSKITSYFSLEELKDLDDKTVYSDVTDYGVVLSSSRPDKKLVPIDLSAPVPKYSPCRTKIKVYHGKQAQDQVLHYKLLDGVILGIELDVINVQPNENIKTCIAGEDWYISIDRKGNVEQFIMRGTRNKALATEEMRMVLETYKNRLESLTDEDAMKLVA